MVDTTFLGFTLKDWAWLIGGIITLTGAIKGLMEFIKNNRIKRAEFLEKLIQEFNEPKLFLAKRLLDDFWVEPDGAESMSDIKLLKMGSAEKKDAGQLSALFRELLRNHAERSVTGYGEQQSRQSFDDLLDFFTKLDYYLSLQLISKQELIYFLFYFERCAFKADGAVMSYAITYGYPSLFRLLYVLRIPPKNQALYKEGLVFNTETQRRLFGRLRSVK